MAVAAPANVTISEGSFFLVMLPFIQSIMYKILCQIMSEHEIMSPYFIDCPNVSASSACTKRELTVSAPETVKYTSIGVSHWMSLPAQFEFSVK